MNSAVHLEPPPVPGSSATVIDVTPDVLVGVDADVPKRQTNTVQIPAGALLCFYTDGLVERRGAPIEANLTRLCESRTSGPPDPVGAAVMAALIGREAVRDDVGLLKPKINNSGAISAIQG
jgi:hypothetical protein